MATKPAQTHIENCQFTNNSAANAHTRDAVVALARAAEENARTIAAIARTLTHQGTEQVGLKLEQAS